MGNAPTDKCTWVAWSHQRNTSYQSQAILLLRGGNWGFESRTNLGDRGQQVWRVMWKRYDTPVTLQLRREIQALPIQWNEMEMEWKEALPRLRLEMECGEVKIGCKKGRERRGRRVRRCRGYKNKGLEKGKRECEGQLPLLVGNITNSACI